MNYFLVAILTTSSSAIAFYFLLNKLLRIKIQPLTLFLCAVCSLFISMALPKVIIKYTDWLSTLAVLCFIAMICSYFLAYYEDRLSNKAVQAVCENDGGETFDDLAVNNLEQKFSEQLNTELDCELMSDSIPHDNYCDSIQQPCEIGQSILLTAEEQFYGDGTQLIEQAFCCKEAGEYYTAAKIFQKLLQENKNSDAAPLLALEAASALKNSGSRLEAIILLTESLSYNRVIKDQAMVEQIHLVLNELQQHEFIVNGGSKDEEKQ